MKIKTKKRMSPEEYAKYMIDKHGVLGLESKLIDDDIIDAPKRYALTFELNPVSMEEMSDTGFENKEFTVEIEEELTEDTVIPKMLEKSFDAYQNVVLDIQVNHSINMVKENAEVLTLHIINDDDTHTLIWKDGRLVK